MPVAAPVGCDATPDGSHANERLQQLAQALDCFTEDEHLLLSGWKPETAKAKRKRGEGPPYIRHGLHYFYPIREYQEYLRGRVRQRATVPGKEFL